MTKQITLQEQDALSAYLDNALNPRERQRLETQLQTRPEMRAALNDLRQTQLLLQQTPVIRVPRNFTLSPEMAGLRTRPPRAYPAFQWAFTLASLFFILVIGGEVFFRSPDASPATDLAMAPVAAESFALEESPAETMDTAPAGNPEGDLGDAQRNVAEAPTEESATGLTEMVPPSDTTPTPDMFFTMAETPTPTPEPTYKIEQATEVVEMPILPTEAPFAQSAPAEPDVAMDTAAVPEETTPAPEPDFWANPWRVPQVALAAVVLLSGVGMILFRRKTML